MANTIADVIVSDDAWTDVYTTTGIAVSTALVIQNKGSATLLLYIAAAAPALSVEDGFIVPNSSHSDPTVSVAAGELGLFAKTSSGTTTISVQEV